MSFFGNIKKISVSTAKVINNGSELLDELAEVAHKNTELLLIKTKASRLNTEVNHLIKNSASPEEISGKRQVLSKKYDEIIKKTLGPERDEYVRRSKSLKNDMTLFTINEMEKRIEAKEKSISVDNFKLAITEIRKLENLRTDLEHLLRITQPCQYELAHQKAKEKIQRITIQIADFQEKRHEETTNTYPSGDRKSRTPIYDGKKHGLSEIWYENGKKEKEISFSHGILSGISRYWRNDGTLLAVITNQPENGSLTHSVFTKSGTKILETSLKNKNGYIDIWLWDGSFVCRANMKNNRINRAPLLIKAVLRKNVWKNLYRARKAGLQQDQFNEMTVTMETYTKLSNELASLMTHGLTS